LGVGGSTRFPDSLDLNQPHRQVSLIQVGGVEEQNRFTVAFLMNNKPGRNSAAFPGAKFPI
jgi:hypothetical protein